MEYHYKARRRVAAGVRYAAALLLAVAIGREAMGQQHPLAGKVVCIDPGHGGTAATDSYRQGPTGEREEWVNLRVGQYLEALLKAKGATVVMTRTKDEFIPLARRAEIAQENHADVFLSIHHNATADSSVNFPIIYFHGYMSENRAGVDLGTMLGAAFLRHIHAPTVPVSVVSDHTVFAGSGAGVLRGTYGIPAVLAEASFFTNPAEEQRLKDTAYNHREAEAYLEALTAFFSKPVPPIHEKNSLVEKIPPFRGLQEADRMSPEAKKWHEEYTEGLPLMGSDDPAAWERAYGYFTRSARSFPDSYVAGQCHGNRAALLHRMGRDEEARQEAIRAKEYYIPSTTVSPRNEIGAAGILLLLDSLKKVYAPEARSAYFNAEMKPGESMTVTLETTVSEAADAVEATLKQSGATVEFHVVLLPDDSPTAQSYAVAHLSVCNHRLVPGNSAELVTQTLLGTPMRILKQRSGYSLVRSPEGYLSWTPTSGITPMDKATFEQWRNAPKAVYIKEYGHAYDRPSSEALPVSDLVHGAILRILGKSKRYYEVGYPDGRNAFVSVADMMPYEEWVSRPLPTAAQILSVARSLMGVPYLWGGTSIKGVDCSGFTKTSYFLNGIILPRDASQQARVGEVVDVLSGDSADIDKCLQNLQAGDLLFFGRRRADGSAAVTHTGIYMGEGKFIHSSGQVKINSMVVGAADYSPIVLRSLVGARRMLTAVGNEGVGRVGAHDWYGPQ